MQTHKNRIKILLSSLFSFFIIYLLMQKFNYLFYLPSIFRVIYLPVLYWLAYLAYILITYLIFLRDTEASLLSYFKRGIIYAFIFHLYFLLGATIIDLTKDRAGLAEIFFLYIKIVFAVTSGLIVYFSLRKLKKINAFDQNRQGDAGIFFVAPPLIALIFFLFYYVYLKNWLFLVISFFGILCGIMASHLNPDPFYNYLKRFFAKDINAIIFIFLLAFAVRAMFSLNLVYKTMHSELGADGFLYASDDGLTYDDTARKVLKDPALLKTGGVEIWGHWDELYSILLAGIYKLFGRNFYIVTILQSFWGSFIPVFIFLIGKILFSRSVGLIAALMVCFKGGMVAVTSFMGHEAVWLPLLYLLVFLLTGYHKNPLRLNAARSFLVGGVFGLLALFRSMYLYLLPYFCLWETFFLKNVKAVKKVGYLLAVGLSCIIIITATFGIFGNRLPLLNNSKAVYLWELSRVPPPFQYIGNERLVNFGINNPFRDLVGAIRAITDKPFEFLILVLKIYPLRIIAYFESYQFGFFDPIYMINPAKLANKFASNLEFYFTIFFLIGLIKCFAKKDILTSPIFLVLTYNLLFLSIILSQFSPRLKEISGPLVYLIGSYGFSAVLLYLKSRNEHG